MFRVLGFRVCRQCARGGCAFYFRNGGAPTNCALASACSPAPTTPTILLPLAAPRREASVPNKHFASRTLSGLLGGRAKQDDFSRRGWPLPGQGQGRQPGQAGFRGVALCEGIGGVAASDWPRKDRGRAAQILPSWGPRPPLQVITGRLYPPSPF